MRAALAAIAACLVPRAADACTTFLLERGEERVVGKSYDWDMAQGLVVTNPKGVRKRALAMQSADRPHEWTAEHASVTFNQYGRELPNGGMNDAGLVIEVMWLESAVAPKPDERPTVSELQWIQEQLDTQSSVAGMVAGAEAVRISPAAGKLHYLACDRTGACAAFEPLGGKLVVTSGDGLPLRVLTNHTYAESLAYYRAEGKKSDPGTGSLSRFVRAAKKVEKAAAGDLIAQAFQTLDSVRRSDTQWNIVYDPIGLRVHWRTPLRGKDVHTFELAPQKVECTTDASFLDIEAPAAAAAPLSPEVNRRLVEKSLKTMKKSLAPGMIERVATYPATLSCPTPAPLAP